MFLQNDEFGWSGIKENISHIFKFLYFCLVAGEQKPTGTNYLGVERYLTSPEGGEKKPAGANSLCRE